MIHRLVPLLLLTLLGPATARAQEAVRPHHKSPGAAFALSLVATVGPALSNNPTATAIGLALGPAVGLFYAGAPVRGLVGIGIRTGVAFAGGIALFAQCYGVEDDVCGITPIVVGGALIAASAIWDIVTAPHAAQRWNRAHAMPVIVPVRGGVGMGMRVEF